MVVFKLFEISFFRLNMATTIAPLYVNVSVQYVTQCTPNYLYPQLFLIREIYASNQLNKL